VLFSLRILTDNKPTCVTGDACGSGVTSGTKQKKITADEKGEATTSTPLTKVITLPPLLDGKLCLISLIAFYISCSLAAWVIFILFWYALILRSVCVIWSFILYMLC